MDYSSGAAQCFMMKPSIAPLERHAHAVVDVADSVHFSSNYSELVFCSSAYVFVLLKVALD